MASRPAAVEAVAVLVKPLVRLFIHKPFFASVPLLTTHSYAGRVAAGAIAEKYLKLAYGIEIVAFVSSVGKIHLPSTVSPPSQEPAEDDDVVEDALSEEFVNLLKTISREEVDKFPTRCPHAETSERMTKVISPSSGRIPQCELRSRFT